MTMTNAEWMIKNKIDFSKLRITRNLGETFELFSYSIFLKGERIATITTNNTSLVNALLEWLDMEYVEPILDDAERRYLSAVIRPFRKHVQNITKHLTFKNTEEYIIIHIDSSERIYFPHFKADAMYKGMELNRNYTLEELGL